MGFTDSNDGGDGDLVLMIVLVWRSDFSVFTQGVQHVDYYISNTVYVEV